MTTFWFVLYIITFIGSLVGGTRTEIFSITANPLIDDWLVGALVGIILIPFLVLGYYAGLFYHVTGYEGSVVWFTVYLVLSIISIVQSLYKREMIKMSSWAVSTFLIFMMGGMGQLANLF